MGRQSFRVFSNTSAHFARQSAIRFGPPVARRSSAKSAGRVAVLAMSLVLLLGVAGMAAGCGVTVGPLQELVVDEPFVSAAVADLRFELNQGRLTLSPGAEGLVSGTVQYNVEQWKPNVSRKDDRLTIEQGSDAQPSGDASVINDWDLKLGQTPIRLRIALAAGEGSYELGGLSLLGLDVSDGAAKTSITFDAINPSQMDLLRYRTAASDASLQGLANANFAKMEFTGAAGNYALDFTGQSRSDSKARVDVSAGTLRIVVPSTTRVEVKIKSSVAELVTEGPWTIEGTTCRTPALVEGAAGKTLTIEVEAIAGSITLVCQ